MSPFNCFIFYLTLIVIRYSSSINYSSCERPVFGFSSNREVFITCNILNTEDFSSAFNQIQGFNSLKLSLRIYFNSNITTLNQKAFQGENIREYNFLEISNSNISIIEEETFRNRTKLFTVVLDNNKIQRIERNAFPESLANLDLKGNLLKSIPGESLACVKSLSALYLENNRIVNISSDDFNENSKKSLDIINLSHNEISTIPLGMFRQFSCLKLLILKYNKIESIGVGAFPDELTELKLSGNRLKRIPTESLKFTNYIPYIDLSYNFITKIDDNDLIPFGKSIHRMYLDDNQISTFRLKSMEIMKKLVMLDLRNNSIRAIQRDVFQIRISQDLNFQLLMSGNPLQCHRDLLWLKEHYLKLGSQFDDFFRFSDFKEILIGERRSRVTKCWSKMDQKLYRVIEAPMIETYDISFSSGINVIPTLQKNLFSVISRD